MIATDEDALKCDLAETYHILNYESLPPMDVATFSVGLRENSRIKLKLNGYKVAFETILLAACLDKLNFLAYTKTEDAQKHRNPPQSTVAKLLDISEDTQGEYETFNSGEEFEQALEKIRKKGG
jgi:hypothetical protein